MFDMESGFLGPQLPHISSMNDAYSKLNIGNNLLNSHHKTIVREIMFINTETDRL